MPSSKLPPHTIIPAQPGYAVLMTRTSSPPYTERRSGWTEHEAVIAWAIGRTSSDSMAMSVMPVTIKHGIMDHISHGRPIVCPDGKVVCEWGTYDTIIQWQLAMNLMYVQNIKNNKQYDKSNLGKLLDEWS